MRCPRCDQVELEEKSVKGRGTRVDRCPGCKGVWFDENELVEVLGTPKVHVKVPEHAPVLDDPCPRCAAPLRVFCYPGTTVVIDMCRACGGIWLDDKEFQQIKAVRSVVRDMTRQRARVEDAATGAPLNVCPKCGHAQAAAGPCAKCGVYAAKYHATRRIQRDRERRLEAEYPHGTSLKGVLLRFVNRSIERLMDY